MVGGELHARNTFSSRHHIETAAFTKASVEWSQPSPCIYTLGRHGSGASSVVGSQRVRVFENLFINLRPDRVQTHLSRIQVGKRSRSYHIRAWMHTLRVTLLKGVSGYSTAQCVQLETENPTVFRLCLESDCR